MSNIFKINEELASIAVTSTELYSVSNTIHHYYAKNAFMAKLSPIILQVNKSYFVLADLFSPFLDIKSMDEFTHNFDTVHSTFKQQYLMEIAKPRKYCDEIYDDYREMKTLKEAQTKYPLLKTSFARLHLLYDKWIDNDAYLPMAIDRATKLFNNFLTDIGDAKNVDIEDAFLVYQSAMDDFRDYIAISEKKAKAIEQMKVL